jgi:hypothetical protein
VDHRIRRCTNWIGASNITTATVTVTVTVTVSPNGWDWDWDWWCSDSDQSRAEAAELMGNSAIKVTLLKLLLICSSPWQSRVPRWC